MAGWVATIFVGHLGCFCISATLAVDVLRQTSHALFSGFGILGDAIVANMENHAPKP